MTSRLRCFAEGIKWIPCECFKGMTLCDALRVVGILIFVVGLGVGVAVLGVLILSAIKVIT